MAVLDSLARSLTRKLVGKFGKSTDMVLIRTASQTYDTTTGEAELTTTRESFSGVVTVATKAAKDGRVQVGDYLVLAAAADANFTGAPTTDDRLELDGSEYQIVDVGEQWSGDQVFAYEIAARGA